MIFETPFCAEKNLGREYNRTMKRAPKGEFVVLRDLDTMLLTPDAPLLIQEAINKFPDTGIFTAFTNRISPSSPQLWNKRMMENSDVRFWVQQAQIAKAKHKTITEIGQPISGFLMVINRSTWEKIKFREGGSPLGVDSEFSKAVLDSGLKIRRIDSLLVFHTYRLTTGIHNKHHLAV